MPDSRRASRIDQPPPKRRPFVPSGRPRSVANTCSMPYPHPLATHGRARARWPRGAMTVMVTCHVTQARRPRGAMTVTMTVTMTCHLRSKGSSGGSWRSKPRLRLSRHWSTSGLDSCAPGRRSWASQRRTSADQPQSRGSQGRTCSSTWRDTRDPAPARSRRVSASDNPPSRRTSTAARAGCSLGEPTAGIRCPPRTLNSANAPGSRPRGGVAWPPQRCACRSGRWRRIAPRRPDPP